nr:ABC transporter permease subunit [Opitutaceae bacterium]
MNAETPVGGRSARATFGLHIALGIGAFVMLAPLAWMLLTSLKSFPEIIAADGSWLPADPQWGNYATVMGDFAYHRFFVNSLFVTGMVVAGTLLTCCPAAYAFAFYDLPYRNLLFALLLATMMLPGQVTVIPIFSTFVKLGWINTYLPMVVPAWLGSNVFGIFLLRQHFRTIPPSYIEAARVDGASEWTILWRLIVPMSLPVVLTVAIFTLSAAPPTRLRGTSLWRLPSSWSPQSSPSSSSPSAASSPVSPPPASRADRPAPRIAPPPSPFPMSDLAQRFPQNPLLTPADLAPSGPGLEIACVLNPGVFRRDGRVHLLVRVAERATPAPGRVRVPVLREGRVEVLDFAADDPELDT